MITWQPLRNCSIAIFILLTIACSMPPANSSPLQNNAGFETGTVTYVDLEGGFYGIVSDAGRRYDPVNLGKAFRVHGLRIRFKAEVRQDVVGFRMWGLPVEILHIEKLSP